MRNFIRWQAAWMFELTAFAKFKLSAFPVGWFESLGEEDSMDTIREALKKRP